MHTCKSVRTQWHPLWPLLTLQFLDLLDGGSSIALSRKNHPRDQVLRTSLCYLAEGQKAIVGSKLANSINQHWYFFRSLMRMRERKR